MSFTKDSMTGVIEYLIERVTGSRTIGSIGANLISVGLLLLVPIFFWWYGKKHNVQSIKCKECGQELESETNPIWNNE